MRFCILPLLLLPCLGQVTGPVDFDVASLKPSAPVVGNSRRSGITGGPGSKFPNRLVCENVVVNGLIAYAFDIDYQYISGPEWMRTDRYDIAAAVPDGASHEDVLVMFQRLLADRFQLEVIRDKKQMSALVLTIAKGGSKLRGSQQSQAQLPQPDTSEIPIVLPVDADGYPVLPPGTTMAMAAGKARIHAADRPLSWLTRLLGHQLHTAVIDETGLEGSFDITLSWSTHPSANDNSPDLISALREQRGLKLEPGKGLVDVLAVKNIERKARSN